MVVMVLENARPSIRGELTRWMLEPKAGVFVGKLSRLVREKLWEKVRTNVPGGIMFHSSPTEQGFGIESFGNLRREIVDLEGLDLVHVLGRTRFIAE
jgi:CRISPR-associated protein Cas2